MSEQGLNIEPATLQAIAAVAIMQHIGDDGRDALIKSALVALLTPPPMKDAWDKSVRKSPLQLAFDAAIIASARTIVHEEIQKPEYREKLTAIVREAAEKAFNDDDHRVRMVEHAALAISKAASAG